MPDNSDTDGDGTWEAWFARWSLPLAQVTDAQLHAFIEYVRTHDLTGRPRTLAASSVRRARAVVRAVFTHAPNAGCSSGTPGRPSNPNPPPTTGSTPTWS